MQDVVENKESKQLRSTQVCLAILISKNINFFSIFSEIGFKSLFEDIQAEIGIRLSDAHWGFDPENL
jgi:hypothetical protein